MYLIIFFFFCDLFLWYCTWFFSGSIVIQMAPTKHAATKKPSSKRAHTDSDNFRSAEVDMKYNDCYKDKTIIMERVVQLESLEGTFILEVFKERTWTKLLNPVGVVYSEIIKEFFSNAVMNEDRIECWVRHKEFVITRDSIQEYLEIRPPSQPISVQYEDRLGSIANQFAYVRGQIIALSQIDDLSVNHGSNSESD